MYATLCCNNYCEGCNPGLFGLGFVGFVCVVDGFVGLICVFIRWWLWVTFLTGLWSRWWREMMRIIPRSWETRLPSWRTRWRDSTTCALWAGAAEVPHLSVFLSVVSMHVVEIQQHIYTSWEKKIFMQAQFEMYKLLSKNIAQWRSKKKGCSLLQLLVPEK